VDNNARLSQNFEGAVVDAFDFVLGQDTQIGTFETCSIKTCHGQTPFRSITPNQPLLFSGAYFIQSPQSSPLTRPLLLLHHLDYNAADDVGRLIPSVGGVAQMAVNLAQLEYPTMCFSSCGW
jgi:hypothetical protein